MNLNELKQTLEALPESKKQELLQKLTAATGTSAEALIKAAKEPKTAEKLSGLAEKIDAGKLNQVAQDPAKLASLLSSPQGRAILKGLDLGKK